MKFCRRKYLTVAILDHLLHLLLPQPSLNTIVSNKNQPRDIANYSCCCGIYTQIPGTCVEHIGRCSSTVTDWSSAESQKSLKCHHKVFHQCLFVVPGLPAFLLPFSGNDVNPVMISCIPLC